MELAKGADTSQGVEVFEEGEGGGGDGDAAGFLPAGDGGVEVLGGTEGDEVPGVTVVVNVLRIATKSDALVLGDALVDGVQGRVTEGVDKVLEVGQHARVARLEAGGVAGSIRIKGDKGAEDGVGVDAAAVVVALDEVGGDELAVPVGLEEAEDLGSLGAGRAGETEDLGKGLTLNERAVLSLGGEERGTVHLLPEVEASGVPRDKTTVSLVFPQTRHAVTRVTRATLSK